MSSAPAPVTPPPDSRPPPPQRLRELVTRSAGLLVALLAGLVLVGWTFDLTVLKRVIPGFVPMLPTTALGLAVSAIALLLAASRLPYARWLVWASATALLYIGGHSLGEYMFGLEGALRHVLYPNAADGHRDWEFTMSQAAATSFLLFGLTMLFADASRRWSTHVFTVSATAGLLLAMGSVLGYLYGAEVLLGGDMLQTIALHTAIAFMLLFGGALVLRADIGWLSIVAGAQPAESSGRSLLALVIVLPVFSAWAVQQGERRGLYDTEFRLALLALLTVVLLSVLVLFYTRRTARLYRARLQAAEALRATEVRIREEADETNRRKDAFLATLSHELRNPLAPLSAAAQVLGQRQWDDPALSRLSDILERQTRHMARLIDDLLDVSRISLGRIELRRKPLRLARIIEEAVESTLPSIEAARHTLVVSPVPGDIEVEADETRISQVLINVLQNAAKFTHPGGEIFVEVEGFEEEAIIRVRDSGIGIDRETADDIFAMFTQATHDSMRGAGLGVGLALAKELVELHGGRIEFHSEGRNKGSEFLIAVPRLRRTGEVGMETPGSTQSLAGDCADRRVLVVDDNVDAAEMLAAYLEMHGLQVRCAHDGPAALSADREFIADALVLDIGLPGMDGYEVARALRQIRSDTPPVLVALTGWTQARDREQARQAGFDHHLAKPVDPDTLLSILCAPDTGRASPSRR